MIHILLIITILIITGYLIYDTCTYRHYERFEKQNNKSVFVVDPKTRQKQLNPIIIQKIMNDDYYVSGNANANNVGIRARVYDHFKPDRLDMKNVKKDINKK